MSAAAARRNLADDVRPREVWAWAMYDFANSGYTTVVITAVFNAYFVAVVAGGAPWATLAWTLITALSALLIMITAPMLGAYADLHARKKKLLLLSTIGCVLGTALLALAGPGELWLAAALLVISNFFFGTGENLVAAFLPELARGKAIGKISGWGWSLGYFGGLLSLAVCLAIISAAQGRGQTAAQFVPLCMLATAVLFMLASLPTFLFLRERARPQPGAAGADLLRSALQRIANTLHEARRYRDLGRFLLCGMIYQSGIAAVISLAAIYAEQVMGFAQRETIMLIFVVNITAALGALLFGYLQDRIGHVRTIAITLLLWTAMVLIAWAATTRSLFWVAANLAGVAMGASQSAGRAVVGLLAPKQQRAEFYGLWGLAVRCSSIFGPLTYGFANWLSGGNHRLAMVITGSYFVAGLVLLAGIDIRRGRRAALRAGSARAKIDAARTG